ncbi:hypothetical protein [Niabella hirudinis]|uniref:hypothetical protein n=1 Tax=Niabella hirudinis TaxID=1285929 RepID=UPI003EBC7D38
MSAQTPKVQNRLEWFEKGTIIQGVSINNDGDRLVFVKRLRDTSGLQDKTIAAEKGVENLLPAGGDTRRRLDPVIVYYNMANRRQMLLDYGWSPRFSPNSNRVVYAHQEKPLGNARIVAGSLGGNDIRIFDLQSKKTTVVVAAPRGFLMEPVFTDSARIIYKTGDAVNGPYAAGISFSRYNLVTKKTELLRGARIQHRLYDLMGEVYGSGNQYAFTVYSPQDSAPGLANEYAHLLMRGNDTLHQFGIRHFSNLDFKFALLPRNQLVYLDDNHLMTEDTSFLAYYQAGKLIAKKPVDFEFVKAWLSPDGRFLFYTNNKQEAFVVRISDFSKTQLPLAKKEIHSVVWASDGGQVAIVQDHDAIIGTDILRLFTVN